MPKKGETPSFLTAFMSQINWINYKLKGSFLGSMIQQLEGRMRQPEYDTKVVPERKVLINVMMVELKILEMQRRKVLDIITEIQVTGVAHRKTGAERRQEAARAVQKVFP